jgi:prevent-host-death family protein
VPDVSATDASRRFSDLLDAVEHRGERFTIVRRGRAIAQLEPVPSTTGREAKLLLRRHRADSAWRAELDELRGLLEVEDRG